MEVQEIIIIGGGLIGAVIAVALAKHNIPSVILDQRDITNPPTTPDHRGIAITAFSAEWLAEYGLWQNIAEKAGKISHIHITDHDHPLCLDFTIDDLYSGPNFSAEAMGYMVPAGSLQRDIWQASENHPLITKICPVEIVDIDAGAAKVALADGREIQGKLVIIADGKKSHARSLVGIKAYHKDYAQQAIITNIEHEYSHNCVAYEKFYSAGPVALLPLKDLHQTSVVWVERPEIAATYLSMHVDEQTYWLKKKIGDTLGEFKLISPMESYKLSLNYSKEAGKGKALLVGDAFHAIHPIAGQGYNLGLRDVAALISLLRDYQECGLELDSPFLLKAYAKARVIDNMAMVRSTDVLDALFRSQVPVLPIARRAGLSVLQRLPSVKRRLIKYAMGYRI